MHLDDRPQWHNRNFTNLDGIKNGGLSAQCLMVDFDIIMKARLQFLKTKAFLEPITIFQFTGFLEQFQYRMILFVHDKIYLVLPLGSVIFYSLLPSSPLPKAINKGSSLRRPKGSNEKDANTYFGSRIHRACQLPQILRVLHVVRITKLA